MRADVLLRHVPDDPGRAGHCSLMPRARGEDRSRAVGIALTAASNPLALVFTVPALACVLLVSSRGRRTSVGVAARGVGCGSAAGRCGRHALALLRAAPGRFAAELRVDSGVFGPARRNPLLPSVPSSATGRRPRAVPRCGRCWSPGWSSRSWSRCDDSRPPSRTRPCQPPPCTTPWCRSPVSPGRRAAHHGLPLPLAGARSCRSFSCCFRFPRRWIPLGCRARRVRRWSARASSPARCQNLAQTSTYFTYRSPETRCLDSKLPPGMTVGYSTFSDARRIELTSTAASGSSSSRAAAIVAPWLTNRDYARDNVGRFFYINDHGDEAPISVGYLEGHFGTPRQLVHLRAGGDSASLHARPQGG